LMYKDLCRCQAVRSKLRAELAYCKLLFSHRSKRFGNSNHSFAVLAVAVVWRLQLRLLTDTTVDRLCHKLWSAKRRDRLSLDVLLA
jgi:hypothetical protein